MSELSKEANLEPLSESYYGFIYHYYRAEVYRETNWRNRLDVTTNWAIVVTAAILSYVFTNQGVHHTLILLNFLIVWFFLYVESRRFRYYSLLKERTRLLEHELLSPIFSGEKLSTANLRQLREKLAKSLEKPQVVMSRVESVAWRLRRNYILLFPVLFLAWLAKVQTYPVPAETIYDVFYNAQVWFVPGTVVLVVFLTFVAMTISLALYLPVATHDDDLP